MTSCLYIGAGLDILPILLLNTVTTFIYIDSQPSSEYGIGTFGDTSMVRHTFLSRLRAILDRNGFVHVSESMGCLLYRSPRGAMLKYYINTPFPEHVTDAMRHEIEQCESLVLCGFDPDKILLSMMPRLKTIYCDTHTVYVDTEYDERSILHELITHRDAYDYTYCLIEQIHECEYWKDEMVHPGFERNYRIVPCKGLDNTELPHTIKCCEIETQSDPISCATSV